MILFPNVCELCVGNVLQRNVYSCGSDFEISDKFWLFLGLLGNYVEHGSESLRNDI